MAQSSPIRWIFLAVLSIAAGFLALAIAVPLEPQVIPVVIALFSPGLKLAETITPETRGSFAWTFGWFLRIAIVTNAAFYFVVFSLVGYLLRWRKGA